jgi:hypothetical protein
MRYAASTIAILTLAAGASIASADTVRAQYQASLGRGINITRNGNTRDIQTVQFNWTRSDNPGPGVDPFIPVNFDSYCVEIDQTISGGTKYTFQVLQPSAAGFTTMQETLLERLWASYFGQIDTSVESAAFQSCVWEITYDGADVTSGNFVVNGNADVQTLAQSWLTAVSDAGYSGPTENLVILHNADAQDQITNVPAPATAALGLLACGVGARRRRTA